MKTFVELEVLVIKEAKGFQGKEPEHKSELIYLDKNKTEYGEEQIFKKIKSMLPVEEHKAGIGRFEVKLVAYSPSAIDFIIQRINVDFPTLGLAPIIEICFLKINFSTNGSFGGKFISKSSVSVFVTNFGRT